MDFKRKRPDEKEPMFFVFATSEQQEKAGGARRKPPLPTKSSTLKDLDRGEGRGLYDQIDQDEARALEIGASAKVIWGTSQGGMGVTIIRVQ